jgi:hypothetical protein
VLNLHRSTSAAFKVRERVTSPEKHFACIVKPIPGIVSAYATAIGATLVFHVKITLRLIFCQSKSL